jgi:hypothetical protein
MRNGVFAFKCQGTHRTNLNALSALTADGFPQGLILEGGDHSLKTPSSKTNGSDAEFLLTYPHTLAAKDTLVGIVGKEGTTSIDREVSFKLSESFCCEFYAKMFRNFLKFTRSVL